MEKAILMDGREQYLDEYKGFSIAVTQTNNNEGYSVWKYGDNEAKTGYVNAEAALSGVKKEIDELISN